MLVGQAKSSGFATVIRIQSETESSSEAQWKRIVQNSETLFSGLSDDVMTTFKDAAASEVTSCAYEPIGQAIGSDAEVLSRDLKLESILLFEGGGLLYWQSPKYLPGMTVSAQFDTNYKVEEVIVL